MFDLLTECLNVIKSWLLSPVGFLMLGFSVAALLFVILVRLFK